MKKASIDLREVNELLESKLKQQEAQLVRMERELLIEAALEKVRKRTLIMKDSLELNEAVSVLFQQLNDLELLPPEARTYFCHINSDKDTAEVWMTHTNGTLMSGSHYTPLNQSESMRTYYEGWKRQEPVMVRDYSGERLTEYLRFLTELPHVKTDEDYQSLFQSSPERIVMTDANFRQGNIGVMTFEPLSQEATDILVRFAQVVEFSYTRFLDLQKAEAQTREAQIEAALEKIRSRSLAMHSSDELREVISHFFEKLIELDVLLGTASIQLYDKQGMPSVFWVGNAIQDPQMVLLPYEDNIHLEDNYLGDGWKAMVEQKDIINKVYSKEQKDRFFGHLFANNDLTQIPESAREVLRKMDNHIICLFPSKNSGLFVDSWDGRIYSEEGILILRKAGKVFEQAYTRFLDLQKAEAQAREAQIQLGLERVRARTMAMHKSEELREAAVLLYKELKSLGVSRFLNCGYVEIDEGNNIQYGWMTKTDGTLLEGYTIPLVGDEVLQLRYDAWKQKVPLLYQEVGGIKLRNHTEFTSPYLGSKEVDEMVRNQFTDPTIYYCGNFSHGYLHVITDTLLNVEEESLLIRFSRVFEMTYKRFLDLKKAEAQAREAQIEAALEKVRSRSLAMHHSAELEQVAGSLFDRLAELGLSFDGALIFIFDKEKRNINLWIATNHLSAPVKIDLPYDKAVENNCILKDLWNAIETGEHIINRSYSGEVKNEYFRYVAKYNESKIPESIRQIQIEKESWTAHFAAEKNSMIGFDSWSGHPTKEEDFKILIRFAKVFEQAYTRFLDLQKAEAHAREAQIEVAVERVRAKALAMHRSEEIMSVVQTLRHELGRLNIDGLFSASIHLKQDDGSVRLWDITIHDVLDNAPNSSWDLKFRLEEMHPRLYIKRIWDATENYFVFEQDEHDFPILIEWVRQFKKEDADEIDRAIKEYNIKSTWFAAIQLAYGRMSIELFAPPDTEAESILSKIGAAFDLAYKRFLDLKKAEAQTREAQIEAALEKIRSRSLAMHHSGEIPEVIATMFEKLRELKAVHNTVAIQFFDFETRDSIFWVGNNLQEVAPKVLLPFDQKMMEADTCHRDLWKAMENGEVIFNKVYTKQQKDQWFEYVFAHNDSTVLEEHQKEFIRNAQIHTVCFIPVKNAGLFASSWDGPKYSEEDLDVLTRTAKVFDQAYTRFLDLQKAEAQAREAQIEAALERVRARAMAMHSSEELVEVAKELRKQVGLLGTKDLETCAINLYEESAEWVRAWGGMRPADYEGEIRELDFSFPKQGIEVIEEVLQTYQTGADELVLTVEGAKLREWMQVLRTALPEIHAIVMESTNMENTPGFKVWWSCAFFPGGCLIMITMSPSDEPSRSLLKRFAQVFGLAYRRFADLKKAEAQARESQIQLGLERVRARAMAMQKSDELNALIGTVFVELTRLDLQLTRCLIMIMDPQTEASRWCMANSEAPEAPMSFFVKYHENPPYLAYLKSWHERTLKWEYIIEGTIKKEWDDFIFSETELSLLPDFVIAGMRSPERVYLNASFNNFGNLTLASLEPLSTEHSNILLRFARVFDLTYTRFHDLQKAEASTRLAVRQAALDRVRAEIASMRTPEDLQRVTPVIWNELTTLGIPFIRCGVFIINEKEAVVEVYLSTPDGQSLAVLHLPFDSSDITYQTVASWRKGNIYHQHWNREDFINWSRALMEQGQIQSPETYQGATAPPESLDLHFVPFAQGMLYVGAPHQLGEEEIELVKALAEAFAIAYARYEDFIKLDKAKENIEVTLTELKATQAQLIQKEKLASLGELTAGIAHEIQNPLNFINNFSEVNVELLQELNEEVDKGNLPEARALISDLSDNERKIHHHGRRAEAIVRGMMQHARATPGERQPTDLNALADEYLRLAYHGVRAKDSTFTCALETDFDPGLGRVNLVAPDIGRVLLNLYTNAFYALQQKRVKTDITFTPTVWVKTQRRNGNVEIRVRDNGGGIPPGVVGKIFQPFFTTKPTGEGTGLGLSLSYDIVTKGHGGELRVDTQAGKYSEFIIELPIKPDGK